MEVGINFFPDVTPQEKPADVYFDESLRIVSQADELGYHHVRIVEHYFHHYGGYSPNPIVFLSAAAQRSRHLACHGSGVLLGTKMRPLLDLYRDTWRAAGHPGRGRVMIAFHMFCHENGEHARKTVRGPLNHYLHSLVEAASDWVHGTSSADYPGYGQIIAALENETFDTVLAKGGVWAGTPDEIVAQAEAYNTLIGGFEVASLQVNFATLPFAEAERSVQLFGRQVLPRLAKLSRAAA